MKDIFDITQLFSFLIKIEIFTQKSLLILSISNNVFQVETPKVDKPSYCQKIHKVLSIQSMQRFKQEMQFIKYLHQSIFMNFLALLS